jgi:NADH-quinone oxidoreductase subunit G
MSAAVTLTIDGQTVQAAPGTLLIEVCKRRGVEVPSFCYYPGYSLQAACRMCLVDIEKAPKLQTACTVPVTEGMVVWTGNDRVKSARRNMLEFLLTNHPLDCPVCDKGGECELQDMVFRYGAGQSRFVEEKLHVPEQKWSPVVYYDAPRCILCYRCIRVCNEGMGVAALGLSYRGVHAEIVPNQGDHLECEQCGMCIDVCPVGALTSGAYRYQARPWEIQYVATVCTHCGDGCKTTLSVRNNQILRGNNRDQSGVNGEFLCIKGRYGYDFTHHPERLTRPQVRRNGQLVEATWTEAIAAVAEGLRRAQTSAVIGSTHTSNEENYFLQKFARQGLKTPNIDHHRSADFPALMDALAGRRKALATSRDLLAASAVVVIGNNPTDQHPLLAWNIRAAVRLHRQRLYLVNRAEIPLFRQAQACELCGRGEELAALERLGERLRQEQDVIICFGPEIKGPDVKRLVAFGDTLPGATRYLALADNSNSRGASDMGLLPGLGPGYTPVAAGWALDEIMEAASAGHLDALYVVGANPVRRFPLIPGSCFVVVQELFLTDTARCADVALPAASAYEKSGTVTNTCGEVQRLKKGLTVNGTKTDLDILSLVAREMGWDLGVAHPPTLANEVFEEIRRTVRGYDVSAATLLAGAAVPAVTLNGPAPHPSRPELIVSANDTLFTSGTLGRYCQALNEVPEARTRKNPTGIGS